VTVSEYYVKDISGEPYNIKQNRKDRSADSPSIRNLQVAYVQHTVLSYIESVESVVCPAVTVVHCHSHNSHTSAESFDGWRRRHLQRQTIPDLRTGDWKESAADGRTVSHWPDKAAGAGGAEGLRLGWSAMQASGRRYDGAQP